MSMPEEEIRRGWAFDGETSTKTITTTAIAAEAIVNGPPTTTANAPGGYWTFENAGATDIHLVFGASSGMNAPTATANGGLLAAGKQADIWLTTRHTHYRAIAITSSSTLRYWRS